MIRIGILFLLALNAEAQVYNISLKKGQQIVISVADDSGIPDEPPPSSEGTATIESHRFGADMTLSQNTDTRVTTSCYYMEMKGFEFNIRPGVFADRLSNNGIAVAELTGLIRHDLYNRAQNWYSISGGSYGTIPDHALNAWTSAGATAFGVTAGTSKTVNYPDQIHDLYQVSGGAYGFDTVTNTMGASNMREFYQWQDFEFDWMEGQILRKVSTAAYSLGKPDTKDPLMRFSLAGRSTSPGSPGNFLEFTISQDGQTFYGFNNGVKVGHGYEGTFNRQYWNNYPGTSRWFDAWEDGYFTRAQMDTYTRQQITKCAADGGWFNDFGHWHEARNTSNLALFGAFYDSLNIWTNNTGAFAWRCSNGEAIEYMFVRQCASNPQLTFSHDTATISVSFADPFAGTTIHTFPADIPTECLNIPLSVRINLEGTALEGLNVKSSYGKLRHVSGDVFVAEVPFDSTTNTFTPVTITSAADTSDYYTTTRPVIVSANVAGSTLTVTTDIPTKAALFRVATGGNEIDYTNQARSNTLGTTHTFTLTAGNTYKVGVISEFKQAKLSNAISF